jgi:membrane protease YdiL (CAAX protease family)
VSVFIIALWEEVVNRGYIQTRLQTSWGCWGVIVTTLLFASMHIPSALLDYGNPYPRVILRFLEAGLTGFVLSYLYWYTGSVVTTIAVHGMNNFAASLLFVFTGVTHQQLFFNQTSFQLPWLVAQAGMVLLLSRIFRKK